MDTNSSVGLAVGLFFFLFIAYLYLESRESDARGVKQFSPQKLGKVLKKTFALCLPDCILLQFANMLICCGFVGNSCMENIHSDEDVREAKKMARLAATLGKSSKSSKSSKKKSKHRKDEEGGNADDAEESLFSGGDNDSDLSDLENGSVDSGHRRSRSKSSKSKSRHSRSSDDNGSADNNLSLRAVDRGDVGLNFKDLTHTRPSRAEISPPVVELMSPLHLPENTNGHDSGSFGDGRVDRERDREVSRRGEKRDTRESRLNLSQHSTASTRSSVVSRESLQALIAAEDVALGYRGHSSV